MAFSGVSGMLRTYGAHNSRMRLPPDLRTTWRTFAQALA